MVSHAQTAFTLRDVNKAELQQLRQVLWRWSFCAACKMRWNQFQLNCRDPYCLSNQPFDGLNPFLKFYKQVTSSYVPDFFGPDDQALRSHQDLFDIISVLRDHGERLSRDECRLLYFSTRRSGCDVKGDGTSCHVPLADQERAFNLAATIMTMVKTSSLNDVLGTPTVEIIPSDEEQGRTMLQDITSPLLWRPEQTLHEALLDSFPSRTHPNLQPADPQSKTILHELTAINLTKIAKLRFAGTNDLRNHLRLDPVSGTMQIFHYTSFLKQHLLSSKRDIDQQLRQKQTCHTVKVSSTSLSQSQQHDDPTQQPKSAERHALDDFLNNDPELEDNLTPEVETSFYFPRSLALETLQTLTILFPPPSHPQFPQCQSLLRSLVAKSNFDPDTLRFGTTAYQLPFEAQAHGSSDGLGNHDSRFSKRHDSGGSAAAFPTWGTRLMALYAELEDPTPRGILDNWLERRSKSRHVMMVTLAGVMIAIILGVLSLGISILQAWISWEAWKNPV